MPSPEAEALIAQARGRKAMVNSNYDPAEWRRTIMAGRPQDLADESTWLTLDTAQLEVRPPATGSAALLYLNGGGFCFGPNDSHRRFVDTIAAATQRTGILLHYRLAPEHPFPAASVDAALGLDHVGGEYQDWVVAADSAGAAILLGALLKRRNEGRSLPAAIALLSPLTDLALSGLSYVVNSEADPMFGVEALIHKVHHYLQGASPTVAEASPYWGDLSGLPPILIHCGSTEVMRDDAIRFAEKVKRAGGTADVSVYPEMPHTFPLFHDLPEAIRAQEEIAQHLRR